MIIGIDADGGDNGYKAVLDGVFKYLNTTSDLNFKIYGDMTEINEYLKQISNFDKYAKNIEFVNTTERIEMNEHPVFALRTKKNSSIALASNDLINKNIDAFLSAGSTGALLAVAQLYVKPIKGISRPAISAIVPTMKNPMLIIDCGANMDSEAMWLNQFAIMGSVYYRNVFNVEKPRVALLNVGVEETKGNKLALETFQLLKNNNQINFIGNIEAREVTDGNIDVLVSDGFSGNILIKMYEGTSHNLLKLIKNTIKSNLITKIGGVCIKNKLKQTLLKYNQSSYGAAPLLGASRLIMKCHGNSTANEIYNSILQTKTFIKVDLINQISQNLEG